MLIRSSVQLIFPKILAKTSKSMKKCHFFGKLVVFCGMLAFFDIFGTILTENLSPAPALHFVPAGEGNIPPSTRRPLVLYVLVATAAISSHFLYGGQGNLNFCRFSRPPW